MEKMAFKKKGVTTETVALVLAGKHLHEPTPPPPLYT